jgi:hypothetical protein
VRLRMGLGLRGSPALLHSTRRDGPLAGLSLRRVNIPTQAKSGLEWATCRSSFLSAVFCCSI